MDEAEENGHCPGAHGLFLFVWYHLKIYMYNTNINKCNVMLYICKFEIYEKCSKFIYGTFIK